ncbi:MAG: hypothetical protein NXI16_01310 [Alphaproteobacteria bacterium]|nr:hypothetical protein [Alphaproteobacteria bacterium]
MLDCLSPDQLNHFLQILGPETYVWVTEKLVIVHAGVADVVWTFSEETKLFCMSFEDTSS